MQAPSCINLRVEYEVQRLLDSGKVTPKHLRATNTVRGLLTIAQEPDTVRHRAVLVARLVPSSTFPAIPPLFDVSVVTLSGSLWTLAGYERIETGALNQPQLVGQAWIVEPVFVQDLIDVEHKWAAASGRIHLLEQQLLSLGHQPAPPQS